MRVIASKFQTKEKTWSGTSRLNLHGGFYYQHTGFRLGTSTGALIIPSQRWPAANFVIQWTEDSVVCTVMADPSWARLSRVVPEVLRQLPSNETVLRSLLEALVAELIVSPEDYESILKAAIRDRNGLLMSKLMAQPRGSFSTFCQVLRRQGMDDIAQILESGQQETREEHHVPTEEQQPVHPESGAPTGGCVNGSSWTAANPQLPHMYTPAMSMLAKRITVRNADYTNIGYNNHLNIYQQFSCGHPTGTALHAVGPD